MPLLDTTDRIVIDFLPAHLLPEFIPVKDYTADVRADIRQLQSAYNHDRMYRLPAEAAARVLNGLVCIWDKWERYYCRTKICNKRDTLHLNLILHPYDQASKHWIFTSTESLAWATAYYRKDLDYICSVRNFTALAIPYVDRNRAMAFVPYLIMLEAEQWDLEELRTMFMGTLSEHALNQARHNLVGVNIRKCAVMNH